MQIMRRNLGGIGNARFPEMVSMRQLRHGILPEDPEEETAPAERKRGESMTTKITKSEDPMDVAATVDPSIPRKTENENVLEGMQCPECRAFEPFKIEIKTLIQYTDEGSDPDDPGSDQEWGDESYCECVSCGFTATVKDFRTE